jgi:hypothetical protein
MAQLSQVAVKIPSGGVDLGSPSMPQFFVEKGGQKAYAGCSVFRMDADQFAHLFGGD